MRPFQIVIILVWMAARGVFTSGAAADFEKDIRPLLSQRCHQCHGAEKQKGGLRLDQKASAFQGGDSGMVIKPGHASDSRLVKLISGLEPDTIMPPKGERLSASEVALISDWIDRGALWPDDGSAARGADHWAFRKPAVQPAPPVGNASWVRTPIDAFILARIEQEGLAPSPEAGRTVLLRRLSLDLTGLPPSSAEVEAFLRDESLEAYESVVDRLLASPHYGEQWGRHWLDVARYADSDGYEKDGVRPFAYLYRDWVIKALNDNLSFDQFSIEQLAGDLLPKSTLEQKVATGFHRNTLRNLEGGVDQEEFRCKAAVDRANTTAAVWLGLTAGCAECHSHKYDPISQREYYQFYAFFNNATDKDISHPLATEQAKYDEELREWKRQRRQIENNLRRLSGPASKTVLEKRSYLQNALELQLPGGPLLPGLVPKDVRQALELPAELQSEAQEKAISDFYDFTVQTERFVLHGRLDQIAKLEPKGPATKAQVLVEADPPRKTHVHIRGDFLRPGDEVEPGTFSILPPMPVSGRRPTRLDLARWLFDPANPLTSRVAVNRVWMHLFGKGLVNTVNDFGARGEKPAHPQLLDWLAAEYQRMGWNQKSLIRLIVRSSVYRQSSFVSPDLRQRDPNNLWLARQNRLRLEAENVRDASLAACGLLNPAVGGPSIRPPLPADIAAIGYANSIKWTESNGPEKYRRGLYIFFQRTVPYPMLMTFDAPDSNVTCTRRERSNTPLQALTLLNDPVFFDCARSLGGRMARASGPLSQKINEGFLSCAGRIPEPEEAARLTQLFEDQVRLLSAEPERAAAILGGNPTLACGPVEAAALVTVARTLLNLDEFVTRE